jgi:hypothetical protein
VRVLLGRRVLWWLISSCHEIRVACYKEKQIREEPEAKKIIYGTKYQGMAYPKTHSVTDQGSTV